MGLGLSYVVGSGGRSEGSGLLEYGAAV